MLEEIEFEDRPGVICFQEANMGWEDWRAVCGKCNCLGFKPLSAKVPSKEQRSSTVVTLAKNILNSLLIGSYTISEGAALSVSVNNLLVTNVYSRPSYGSQLENMAKLQEVVISHSWNGKMLMVDDWNDFFEESFSMMGASFGLRPSFLDSDTTRWKGCHVIDYVLHNLEEQCVSSIACRSEVASDHKILEFCFCALFQESA